MRSEVYKEALLQIVTTYQEEIPFLKVENALKCVVFGVFCFNAALRSQYWEILVCVLLRHVVHVE